MIELPTITEASIDMSTICQLRCVECSTSKGITHRGIVGKGQFRFRPEGLKLFHNRWYLLGYRNGSEFCAVPLEALTKIYLSGNRFQTDCRFSLAKRLSDSIGVVAPTGQQPEEVTLRAYGPFADYLRKHPFHHSQMERNDMGTFTSFDYTLLVTDELVDEILALGDKVEIAYPEKLRMKLLQKIGHIRSRYAT